MIGYPPIPPYLDAYYGQNQKTQMEELRKALLAQGLMQQPPPTPKEYKTHRNQLILLLED